jgi:hypothetical protein
MMGSSSTATNSTASIQAVPQQHSIFSYAANTYTCCT